MKEREGGRQRGRRQRDRKRERIRKWEMEKEGREGEKEEEETEKEEGQEKERGGKKGGERERERERESSSLPLALTQCKEAGETATLGLPVAFQFSWCLFSHPLQPWLFVERSNHLNKRGASSKCCSKSNSWVSRVPAPFLHLQSGHQDTSLHGGSTPRRSFRHPGQPA